MANRKIDLFNERFNADKKGVRSRVCVASLLHGPYDPQTREDALTLLYRVLTPEYNRCFNRKTFTFKAANVFYITNEQLSLRNQSHAGWWYVIMSGASSALTSRNWGQFFNAAGILNIAPKFRNPATSDNFKYYSTLFLMPDTKGIVLESLISYMKSWMCIDEKILNDLPGNTLKWFLGACSDRGLCGQEDAATSVVGEVITATRSIISVASLSKRTAPSVGVGSGADAQRISRRRVTQSADANHSQILVARVSNDGIFDGSRDISFTANMIQEGLIEPGGRTILPSLSRATGCSISSGSSQAFVAVGQKLLEFDDGRPAGFSFMPSDSMASQSQKGALQLPALTMCPGPFTPSDQGLARYPHHDCLFTPSNDDDGMFPQRSFTPSFMDSQSYQTHCLEDGCMSYLAGINNPPTPEPLAAALHRRFSDTVTGNGYANVLSQLPQLQYLEGAVNLFQAFFSLIQKKHGIVFPNPVALMGTAEFDRLRTAGYDSQQCLEFQTLVRQIPSVFSTPLPLLYPDHFTVLASLNVVSIAILSLGMKYALTLPLSGVRAHHINPGKRWSVSCVCFPGHRTPHCRGNIIHPFFLSLSSCTLMIFAVWSLAEPHEYSHMD